MNKEGWEYMNCVMIILNYNDSYRAWKLAKKCNSFDSIDKVIIVDNCSTDDSIEYFFNNNQLDEVDIVISKANNGFASGNNLGAKYALENYKPNYLFFANTDTIFQECDVDACLKKMEIDKYLGLISMRMRHIDGYEERAAWKNKSVHQHILSNLWVYSRINRNKYTYREYDEHFQYVDVVRGSFMLFSASAFFAVGGFDESTFLYYEEDIIAFRLKEANYKVGLLTDRFYVHNHVYLRKKTNFVTKRYSDKSQRYFLSKYYKINTLEKALLKFTSLLGNIELYCINKLDWRKND